MCRDRPGKSLPAGWSAMEPYLTYIFVLNIFLTFVDATIGYYAAPALGRLAGNEEPERTARGIRRLLAWVVTLYMFFNCLGYFEQKPWLLLFTSMVLAVDITAQFFIFRKMSGRKGP